VKRLSSHSQVSNPCHLGHVVAGAGGRLWTPANSSDLQRTLMDAARLAGRRLHQARTSRTVDRRSQTLPRMPGLSPRAWATSTTPFRRITGLQAFLRNQAVSATCLKASDTPTLSRHVRRGPTTRQKPSAASAAEHPVAVPARAEGELPVSTRPGPRRCLCTASRPDGRTSTLDRRVAHDPDPIHHERRKPRRVCQRRTEGQRAFEHDLFGAGPRPRLGG
jgi:hypothetical protein